MLKRFTMLVFLALAVMRVDAREYTDVYYDTAEPGWGVFLIQSDTAQFLAFFIYGADGKPVWYTAQLADDGTGNFAGSLYAITGTYFLNPWQGYNIAAAGTAKFQPSDPYHATLTYTVNGAGTVTKSIVRQTLTPYPMAGNYSGSMAGTISACSDPASNDPAFRARYGLAVSQTGDQSVLLTFTFVDQVHSGIVCTVSGPLSHFGRLYQVAAQMTCAGPGANFGPIPITLQQLHPTGQGIEGHLTGTTGGGCMSSLHFAAVNNGDQ
jgi:hypothetical protein